MQPSFFLRGVWWVPAPYSNSAGADVADFADGGVRGVGDVSWAVAAAAGAEAGVGAAAAAAGAGLLELLVLLL